jgi:glutamate synthase domain-containing protein 3
VRNFGANAMIEGSGSNDCEYMTGRTRAKLLNDWGREKGRFWQIVPKEMLARLENPVTLKRAAAG